MDSTNTAANHVHVDDRKKLSAVIPALLALLIFMLIFTASFRLAILQRNKIMEEITEVIITNRMKRMEVMNGQQQQHGSESNCK